MTKILFLLPFLLSAADHDWPAYGGGPEGMRYSPLTQIDRSNVAKLKVAWTFDTTEGKGDAQTQPIVVGNVFYGLTAKYRLFALDAATGKELWRFDPGVGGRGPNRGLVYWAEGKDRRIFTSAQSFIYAINADTGKVLEAFGNGGRIDVRQNLDRPPEKQSIVLTTPGIIYKDLLIIGGRLPESLPSPPGDIRAYDVRTGALRWQFHTIPRPGEFGYDTWPKDAWTYTGSANCWAGMAVDERRGIVYAPTGSAASDFYGADRLGDNLFANTLLALDANTGKRIWHFQAVKHDIWDRDFPSPPTLVTVTHGGKRVDAVAQTSKQGFVYLFDRANGSPLFPLAGAKYPASDVPGEVAAGTQVLPSKPAPFSRQILTAEMLRGDWAKSQFPKIRSGGQFVPFGTDRETVIFPGFDGGAEWGGSAFDPETGLLYVNANDIPWTAGLAENKVGSSGRKIYLTNCGTCHGEQMAGSPPSIPSLTGLAAKRDVASLSAIVRQGAGRMPGFPSLTSVEMDALARFVLNGEDKQLAVTESPTSPGFRFTGYHRFLDPKGYPGVNPPWGTLNAINLNTGEYAWRIPFGEYPELGMNTGTENYGGPLVTAGGLVFIGATNFDRKMHAYDKRNGKLLWEAILPAAGNASPVTYQVGGRQYVVIFATGGKARAEEKAGGIYVAFALP